MRLTVHFKINLTDLIEVREVVVVFTRWKQEVYSAGTNGLMMTS